MKSFLCHVLRARLSPLAAAGLTLALSLLGLALGLPTEWFLLGLMPVLFLTNQNSSPCWFRRR